MKKKLLMALFAIATVSSMHASSKYRLTIDNDTDGKQASKFEVKLFTRKEQNILSKYKTFTLRAGKEKTIKSGSPIRLITVRGLEGTGFGQESTFTISDDTLQQRMKVDIDINSAGKVVLSIDKNN